MDLLNSLMSLVNDKVELQNALKESNIYLKTIYKECFDCVFGGILKPDDTHKFKIESILDYLHDQLNTGHWSEVPKYFREAFTATTFIKAIILIMLLQNSTADDLQGVLKCIDMGILLGAPLQNNSNLLTQSASVFSQHFHNLNAEILSKNIKYEMNSKLKRKTPTFDEYESLKAKEIDVLTLPSLEDFYKHYMLPKIPLKIQDCMSHWPACQKWPDVYYILKVAGERTVPIEIGSQYSDENWSQKLMKLKDFILEHYLGDNKEIGYLAQHDLLYQIPELRKDICIPEYCCMSRNFDEESREPEINAWFGPAGTVSSLHFDPKDNLLSQVYGTKQVIVFSPKDSEFLYPYDANLLSNTAQVDPVQPDLSRFPKFVEANMFKCLLRPGEILYIPPKWWHHVTALEKSFSVNFWWQ